MRRSFGLFLFVFFLGLLRPCAADWAQNGSITASGAVVPISNPNASTLSIQVTGTFSGTLQFEGTVDQSNWFSLAAVPVGSGAVVSSTTTTGAWIAGYASLKQARVRASSFVSGTAVVSMNLSPGVSPTSIGGAVSLGATAALADATANPTLAGVQSFPMTFNGTTWDRWKDPGAANAGGFTGIGAVAPMYLDTGTSTMRRAVTAASTTSSITGVQAPASASLLWDTLVFRPALSDSSGRAQVVGAAADGAALAGSPLRMGVSDGTNIQTWRQFPGNAAITNSVGVAAAGLMVASGANSNPLYSASSIPDNTNGSNSLPSSQYDFGGTNWERHRNNTEVTLLSSAARTTTQTSADITTYNCGAIQVIYDNTAGTTYSDTLTIDGKDPASGKYYNLLTSAAIATVTTNVYTVDPAIPAVANVTAQKRLPRTIRIVVTAGNGNSHTYSVGYILQPT